MAHYFKANKDADFNSTSYFAPAAGAEISKVSPFARGSFGPKYPNMGIDYSKLVVEIDELSCGYTVDCLPARLKKLLDDPAALREKQRYVAKYARLFSFGMKDNAFQYADAMSALLVQARHYTLNEDTAEGWGI